MDGNPPHAPFLSSHCISCHGSEKQKGGLNLEEYDGDILDLTKAEFGTRSSMFSTWEKCPPEEKPRPPAKELVKVVDWISGELRKAEQLARAKGPGLSPRRLTIRNTATPFAT